MHCSTAVEAKGSRTGTLKNYRNARGFGDGRNKPHRTSLNPQLQLDVHHKLIVDLFAGGGGMSSAFELAFGRSPDIAINHDRQAIAMHRANHPTTRHFRADVYEVCPIFATGGRPVGWLHASPDCFPAGTMVLAREGYRRIEELQIGDEVLTHKLRWRKITATMSTIRPLMRVRGQGHPGLLVSPEHPFYVRQRRDVWQTEPRGYLRTLEPAKWEKASELDKGMYWASPGVFPADEVPPVPAYRSRTLTISENLMWLAGLYVADGWTRLTNTRAELVITCGKHEADRLRTALDMWPREGVRCTAEELAWAERHTGTAYQFTTEHRGLVEWLREHFGHGASEKRIPGWALGMSEELRRAFLEGYLSGDGCRPKCDGSQLVFCTTVSKSLAFGIKALATSLGHAPAVYVRDNQPDVIQGRKVNVLPAWSVRWRPERERAQSFFEDGMDWAPVREVRSTGLEAEVFNISVEDDESYVVEGVVVHNCTHHSQAAGGQPRSKKIRGLSWVGYRWAGQVHPDVISLENVAQILKWGPLVAKRDKATGRVVTLDMVKCPRSGKMVNRIADPGEQVSVKNQYLVPDPKRAGQTWKKFVRALESLGYQVEWKTIRSCDQGAHTTRERLYMLARRDGQPIVWPEQTHFKTKAETPSQMRWKPAADCIDFSDLGKSIFGRPKDLAEATQRRIAGGITKFVLQNPSPFIVPIAHYNGADTAYSIDEPLRTITAATKGGEFSLVTPMVVPATHQGGDRVYSLEEPLRTVTAANRGEMMLASAYMMQANGGFNQTPGHDLRDPVTTVTNSGSQQQLVTAHLAHLRGNCDAREIGEPLRTVSAGGEHHGLVAGFLSRQFGASIGHGANEPMGTITAGGGGKTALVACQLSQEDEQGALRVAAFLMRYHSTGGQWANLNEPLTTITTRDRLALVTVWIRGEPWVIVDIRLRMLQPRELYRAQDFPDNYIIEYGIDEDGKRIELSKSAQIRMCGNSVNPVPAAAFLRCNAPELAVLRVA